MPDGSSKIEIKELWHNVAYPIDTQVRASWLDINRQTKKIALSIAYAGGDLTGLWSVGLDGKDLKRLIVPSRSDKYLQTIHHPSWTPDGQWIVFEEEMRGLQPKCHNIVKCDVDGMRTVRLLGSNTKEAFCEPAVSPDGKKIVFTKYPNGIPYERYLWQVDINGAGSKSLGSGYSRIIWGTNPVWSPDGSRIFAVDSGVIEAVTGRPVAYGAPVVQNYPLLSGQVANIVMPHWGKEGFLCAGWGGGIQLANEQMTKMLILAFSDEKEGRW